MESTRLRFGKAVQVIHYTSLMTWRRSIRKAIEYRLLAGGMTFITAFVITGRPQLSLGIASLDAVFKILAFACWYRYRA